MASTLQRTGPLRRMGAVLRQALYPTTCMMCDARVEEAGALCPSCWADTPFLSGACCDLCSLPLPGEDDGPLRCDECLATPRPWDEARAALAYGGTARRLILSLKHGDRTELAPGAARWIHRRARDVLGPETLFVPVPIHRWRLLKRRYNQSALLADALSRLSGGTFAPMALHRHRETPSQEGRGTAERFANLDDAISPGRDAQLADRHVALVDDVMTSGATLTACAEVLRRAGAARITVLLLARVAKEPAARI